MKPVFQTRFGEPDGNCHAACLASILEIGMGEIPDFGGTPRGWYFVFRDWMIEKFGLCPIDLEIECEGGYTWIPEGYYIVNGIGPRGIWHSVVGRDGKIVHDPFPGGGGLVEAESVTLFVKVFA